MAEDQVTTAEDIKSLAMSVPKGMLKPPLKKEDLLDKTIIVRGMLAMPGEFGDYARIIITFEKERRVFITGSMMIIERLEAARDSFPVSCTVRQVGRAWLVE